MILKTEYIFFKILGAALLYYNSRYNLIQAVTYGLITGNNGEPLSTVNARPLCYAVFLAVSVDRVAAFPCLYALAYANRIRH